MLNFHGKVILVSGAAGNLGQAVATAFLKAHGSVAALDHRTGRLPGLFDRIDSEGSLHIFEGVDLMDRQDTINLSERIRDQVGMVDVIINTVGGFTYGDPVHELQFETLQKMIDLNLKTFLNICAGFVPHLVEKGGGKVITIGARASLSGGARAGAYAAAKGGLLRLTESMAAELKGDNIQVNCVLPSIIDTPQNRQDMPKADFSKWVTPEKLAEIILFLASAHADDITGVGLPVFGRA